MIRINEDYGITVDSYNYTLVKKGGINKKDGSIIWRSIAHCGDVTGALKAFRQEYVRQGLLDCDITLSTAYRHIVESNRQVEELIENILGDLT